MCKTSLGLIGMCPLLIEFKHLEDLQSLWREKFRIRIPKKQVSFHLNFNFLETTFMVSGTLSTELFKYTLRMKTDHWNFKIKLVKKSNFRSILSIPKLRLCVMCDVSCIIDVEDCIEILSAVTNPLGQRLCLNLGLRSQPRIPTVDKWSKPSTK